MPNTTRIALAAGDGIGPEAMDATLSLFRAAGVLDHLEFVPVEMGKNVFLKGDTRGMTDAAIKVVEECGVLFKGPMETPKGSGGKSINVTARKMWNAFANLRTFRTLPGVTTPFSKAGIPVNLVIVRENIEDTYGGVEHRLSNDMIQCKRLISAPGCDQVIRFAFETARRLGLVSVHCGHKANIMKLTDGLFLDRFLTMSREFPEIASGDVIVDALCMNLVMRPQMYRMVILPNLQGDIVSDLAAGLVGGLGFAPSANIGTHISIFEAVHGTAPDIAGKGVANPTALILSGLMMLRHLGLTRHAAAIENALLKALEDGIHTGDFGDPSKHPVGTTEFAREIADRLGSKPSTVPACAEPLDSGATVTLAPLVRPKSGTPHTVIRTFTKVSTQVVGCDLYLDATQSAAALAEELGRVCANTPFRLSLISNRGTQVWPTGSIYTECVDYWRARFEPREGIAPSAVTQATVIALLDRVATSFTVCSYELLRTFDGVKGYSMAQGQ
ncbi:MAG: isocitrate/isopropylmalate family dehydrogenase [Phycisphaerae bacterium]|nr:isocitrate/isopropylmalate family dehydrogenase [Phycisphaerae bacterium]